MSKTIFLRIFAIAISIALAGASQAALAQRGLSVPCSVDGGAAWSPPRGGNFGGFNRGGNFGNFHGRGFNGFNRGGFGGFRGNRYGGFRGYPRYGYGYGFDFGFGFAPYWGYGYSPYGYSPWWGPYSYYAPYDSYDYDDPEYSPDYPDGRRDRSSSPHDRRDRCDYRYEDTCNSNSNDEQRPARPSNGARPDGPPRGNYVTTNLAD